MFSDDLTKDQIFKELYQFKTLEEVSVSKAFKDLCSVLNRHHQMSTLNICKNFPLALSWEYPYGISEKDLYQLIVDSNEYRLIKFVPNPSEELCIKILHQSLSCAKYIKNKSSKIIETIFEIATSSETSLTNQTRILSFFSTNEMSNSIIYSCLNIHVQNFKYAPQNEKTALTFLKQFPQILNYAQESCFTENVINDALEQDIDLFKTIPESKQTIDICLKAIYKKSDLYNFVKIVPNPTYEATLSNLMKIKAINDSL